MKKILLGLTLFALSSLNPTQAQVTNNGQINGPVHIEVNSNHFNQRFPRHRGFWNDPRFGEKRVRQQYTNYGQINQSIYLGPGSSLVNYGQINGHVICYHCEIISRGQINGSLQYVY